CNAIAPADVVRVLIDERNQTIELIVPDDQLSLAIGRRGQNVRLASQLVEWKIDIHPESKVAEFKDELRYYLTQHMPELDADQIEFMFKLGFHSAENIINADAAELLSVPDLEQEVAEQLQEVCEDLLEARATGKLWGQGGRQAAMQRLANGEVQPVNDNA
ncbi:MAG: transcription termination factor NusA, partial [Myxococcota bacterium]